MSNLKQIGIGIMQYIGDNDETFPPYANNPVQLATANPTAATTPAEKYVTSTQSTAGNLYTWMDFTYPYVKSLQVYDCPSRPFPWHQPSTGLDRYWPHLAYNGTIAGVWDNMKASKLASINGASAKIFATHNRTWAYFYINLQDFHDQAQDSAAGTTDESKFRWSGMWPHMDGQVLLFCDGHAKYIPRARANYYSCIDQLGATFNYGSVNYQNTATDGTSGCGFWNPLMTPPAL